MRTHKTAILHRHLSDELIGAKPGEEVWRAVVGYEGSFEVSNFGRVRNLLTGNILRGGITGRYLMVRLSPVHRRRYVHQLVLEAFHGPRPKGLVANHKNFDRFDNRAENLEWITQQENMIHSRIAGRWPIPRSARRLAAWKKRQEMLNGRLPRSTASTTPS